MNIDGLFTSATPHIANFAQQQVLLYRHDPRLQDYFEAIQIDGLDTPRARASKDRRAHGFIQAALAGACRISRFQRTSPIKADVLLCPSPYFSRETETRFFMRTLLGIARTGATIACLLPKAAPCLADLNAILDAENRARQVHFIDPLGGLSLLQRPLMRKAAQTRGRIAFEAATDILSPHGLEPGEDVLPHFERLAYFVEAWEQLLTHIEFETAVTRCHWLPLCSAVSRSANSQRRKVITFQQGVIGHSLDAPVTASTYVAFGNSSSAFLSHMNRRFFDAVALPEPKVEFISGGCLFDAVGALPDQFANKTLLMVDVPTAQSLFYGVRAQTEALTRLGEEFLAFGDSTWRLIIRPHPFWNNLDMHDCLDLAKRFPGRCEISHPAWPLDDDLRRSSATIGIFSGVLTVASASGLPSYFLQTEGGFSTGDFACFQDGQMFMPNDALQQIRSIFRDPNAYADARATALRNGREYYANGTNLQLDATFFSRTISH